MTTKKNAPMSIDVELGKRSYPIHIGSGLIAESHQYIKPYLQGQKIAIVTDETVAGLHLDTLMSGLKGQGLMVETIILPAGESAKSFERLENVLEQLLALNFSRSDTLIAFGGGVIGDLTGFTASILKRGCGFIQMPTTLLSQVDSAVGGKTAINAIAGKNLVGSFYQPKLVLSDTDVLQTLPARQLKAGYAEVLKYGLIDNLGFFGWLEENGKKVLAGDMLAQTQAISVSCQAKADIVRQDEFEQGRRALLNLGHSFAHALEGLAGYDGRVLHGEAVSAGMLMAYEYGQSLQICSGQDTARLAAHLTALDMPVLASLPKTISADPDAIFRYMLHDKKNSNNELTLILARGIGKCFIQHGADQTSVRAYLKSACEVANR